MGGSGDGDEGDMAHLRRGRGAREVAHGRGVLDGILEWGKRGGEKLFHETNGANGSNMYLWKREEGRSRFWG